MKQTYFQEPKYSKNYLISNPQNLYEQYVNAFAFSEMVKSQSLMPNKKELQLQAQSSWRKIKSENKNIIQNYISELLKTPVQPPPFTFFSQQNSVVKPSAPSPNIIPEPSANIQPSNNATAQKQSDANLQKAKAELCEYANLSRVTTSSELHTQFSSKIKDLEKSIFLEEKTLKRLRVYDTPGRPSFLINEPNLLENMHNSIEFGAADHKRRKEVIKVRTIKHLREKMEENYGIYMANSTTQNYLQPRHSNTKEAKRHHHPAQIRLAAVGRNEMSDHVDEHYCLASIKGIKSFASAFSQNVVLISQDDKAKVPLGIAAVGKTFKAIQTVNEPVSVPDHDFPKGSKHKLIPSVYLVINPDNTNDSLRSEEPFHEFTHHEGAIKPIWCLLTDGGPDENPRFLANILKYLLIFKKLDLDYLSVRTHAPGQSAYNPVERSMASLSGKLAGIVLNAFNYGNHLGNMNGQANTVIDKELGRKNFKHAGEHLCDLWSRDPINGQPVISTYIEEHDDTIFSNIQEEEWEWIDQHSQICKYSLDLHKCENRSCCRPPRAPDAFELLSLNNGFLPPVVQGQDKHYLSLLHTLEYFCNRLPGYDEHCPSIPSELYHELESGVQGIQKDSQSAILEKGHDISEELTYNADQSKNDGTAIVKNSRQINRKQSGNNGHQNQVKNFLMVIKSARLRFRQEDDDDIKKYMKEFGHLPNCYALISEKMGNKINPKRIYQRWTNNLNPNLCHDSFNDNEKSFINEWVEEYKIRNPSS
ncbi:unnamed protein product [Rhizophagus irregularis]|nr:unnamed protein product [Rhizophagus irregularis]